MVSHKHHRAQDVQYNSVTGAINHGDIPIFHVRGVAEIPGVLQKRLDEAQKINKRIGQRRSNQGWSMCKGIHGVPEEHYGYVVLMGQ